MTSSPFAKGHDPAALSFALATGKQTDFDAITRTGTQKLVSPQAALAPVSSSWAPPLIAPPEDDSRQTAAELLEVALASRVADVPFASFGSFDWSTATLAPFADDHRGPQLGAMAFRYSTAHTGPYVSQFLLQDVPVGPRAAVIQQRVTHRTGRYGTTPATRDAILAGNTPAPQTFGPALYVHSPRGLASYVHQDPPYLFGLQAAWLLDSLKARRNTLFADLKNEGPFVTNGGAVDLQCALAEVTRQAMVWAWRRKFRTFRRRRPEELFADQRSLHPDWATIAAPQVADLNGCMPLLYAEGCPGHSDYPSGHAVIGGAVATLLKAWFVDAIWPAPALHSLDGQSLVPWTGGETLTLHGELNKLAANYGWGRNFAGIHMRSSCWFGMNLGEQVALQYLRTMAQRCNETIWSVQFSGFDGQTFRI